MLGMIIDQDVGNSDRSGITVASASRAPLRVEPVLEEPLGRLRIVGMRTRPPGAAELGPTDMVEGAPSIGLAAEDEAGSEVGAGHVRARSRKARTSL
jgi:hypothetical protein